MTATNEATNSSCEARNFPVCAVDVFFSGYRAVDGSQTVPHAVTCSRQTSAAISERERQSNAKMPMLQVLCNLTLRVEKNGFRSRKSTVYRARLLSTTYAVAVLEYYAAQLQSADCSRWLYVRNHIDT